MKVYAIVRTFDNCWPQMCYLDKTGDIVPVVDDYGGNFKPLKLFKTKAKAMTIVKNFLKEMDRDDREEYEDEYKLTVQAIEVR